MSKVFSSKGANIITEKDLLDYKQCANKVILIAYTILYIIWVYFRDIQSTIYNFEYFVHQTALLSIR